MVDIAAPLEIPDPMNLPDDWEEGDEPLASDYHNLEQIHCFTVLHDMFAGPNCYVSFQRWLRRDPLPKLQPDLLVAMDRPDYNRNEYDPRQEGKPPDFLAEWLSPSSLSADMSGKPDAYSKLGVREYWVFNPAGTFPGPRLQGWTLRAGAPPQPLPSAVDGSVASRILPVRFLIAGDVLELLDDRTGETLTPVQAAKRRWRQEFELRMAAEAAQQKAEAEVRRLQAELERLRREYGERK